MVVLCLIYQYLRLWSKYFLKKVSKTESDYHHGYTTGPNKSEMIVLTVYIIPEWVIIYTS